MSSKNDPASVIDAEATLEGTVRFSGLLRIDGKVVGLVAGQEGSRVIVGDRALIDGPVHSEAVLVYGRVLGPLSGKTIEIMPSGRVDGELSYERLQVHPGGQINGPVRPLAGPQPADNGGQ